MGDAGSDDDDPDFFKNVYGQSYSRPTSSAAPRAPERKRESPEGSTSPEKVDPNELPRDFSARGAKLWEDQAKASERNWKRRREEELMCKLCGENGHFAQVVGQVVFFSHSDIAWLQRVCRCTGQCGDVAVCASCQMVSNLPEQCHLIVDSSH